MSITDLKLYKKLKKFYINLDHCTERKESMEEQFNGEFIRRSATYGAGSSLDFIENSFDIAKSRDAYNVMLSTNIMSCTISHYQLYKDIVTDESISEEDWVLIAEDDNLYLPDFAIRLENLLTHLQKDCYQAADLVLLKLFQLEEDFDYVSEILFENNNESNGKIPLRDQEDIKKYDIPNRIRTDESRINDISYTIDGKKQVQKLLTSTYFRPCGSALYIIRKKRCRKIIEKYNKPWWFADDFKKIVPPHRILYVTPFLAITHKTAKDSNLENPYVDIIYRWNKLETSKDFLYFITLKLFNINIFSPNEKVRQKSLAKINKLKWDF